jgi:hypothetical protein
MIPKTALDEKNMDKTNPSESSPVLGFLIKSCKKCIKTELSFSPGTTSLIRPYKFLSKSTEIGNKGMSVNKKMIAEGIAITRLNAMEAALSRMPTVFTCTIKKLVTS